MNLTDNRTMLEAAGIHVREGADLIQKWMELIHVTVPYEFHPYGPCSKLETELRPIFLDAMERAKAAFVEAGAMLPVLIGEDAIRVYEFPRQAQVMFVFYRQVAGKPLEFSRTYDLTPDVVGWLVTTNRWQRVTSH